MRFLKKVAMVVAGLVVIFLWFAAYAGGQDTGYAEGYDIGHTEGHEKGYSEGYDTGYQEDYDTGHAKGYDTGYQEGYDTGHAKGYDTGYNGGYDAGYEEVFRVGKAFRNPTYQEMKDFLRRDTTDRRYPTGNYDCENFASDVCNNAEAEGIRAAVVVLMYEKTGHQIVAFETTDKGLIFIEPQDDKEVRVEVGIRYWGDTIKRFIVCW